MSFIEGMLFCFIGGWLNSFLYRKYLRKKNKAWLARFGIAFLVIIYAIDLLIYTNIIDPRLIFPWVQIPSTIQNVGTYYMFTPGLLIRIPLEFPVTSYDSLVFLVFAQFLFISYIWWFTIGQNMGRFMFGRKNHERGAMWLMRSTKMIKRAQEKLEKKRSLEK